MNNLVTITHRGKRWAGDWTIWGRLITVSVPGYGRKTAQLGSLPPASLAGIMLRELAEDQVPLLPAPDDPQ